MAWEREVSTARLGPGGELAGEGHTVRGGERGAGRVCPSFCMGPVCR